MNSKKVKSGGVSVVFSKIIEWVKEWGPFALVIIFFCVLVVALFIGITLIPQPKVWIELRFSFRSGREFITFSNSGLKLMEEYMEFALSNIMTNGRDYLPIPWKIGVQILLDLENAKWEVIRGRGHSILQYGNRNSIISIHHANIPDQCRDFLGNCSEDTFLKITEENGKIRYIKLKPVSVEEFHKIFDEAEKKQNAIKEAAEKASARLNIPKNRKTR